MRKLRIILFLAVLFFSAVKFTATHAQDIEHIESFNSDINIQSDGGVEIKERIQYVFPNPKHGIVRQIPVKYSVERGGSLTGSYNVYLTLLGINVEKDGKTEAIPYQKDEKGGNVSIKIGDPQKEISGTVNYLIDYRVERAINFSPKENENQDEFYWNVTGTGWEVPINNASAEIHFPAEINPDSWKFTCYTGPLGSKEKECSEEASSQNSVSFQSKWELPAKAGLTVVAGFPKGIVTPPTASEDVKLALQHNFLAYVFLLIPVGAFVLLFITWFLKGRDPKGKGTIIPFYSAPDNLTPVEIGTLVDEKADTKDISSSIIDLAVKGYLKIREVEKKSLFGIFKSQPDYELLLLKKDEKIPALEKEVLEITFPGRGRVSPGIENTRPDSYTGIIKVSELQDRFPQQISTIKENIYNDLVQKGYFPKNPSRVRNSYLFIGAVIAFLGIIIFVNDVGIIGAGSMFLTGVMVAVFGYFMPRKTIKGVNVYEKILGLKEYLTVAEKDRLEFHNAPAKKPEVFEKLLPYAIVLGVEREWAKQFEGIYNHPPVWYEGTSLNNFSTLYLVSALSNFNNIANTAMGVHAEGGSAAGGLSGFGGGGFSGGGFGGGGGGSW